MFLTQGHIFSTEMSFYLSQVKFIFIISGSPFLLINLSTYSEAHSRRNTSVTFVFITTTLSSDTGLL